MTEAIADTPDRIGRHINWGALPGKAELERLFVGGMTYGQLGARYGVRPQTVLSTMKRRAQRDGTPWPLKAGKRAAKPLHDPRWDSVTTQMVRLEILDCCANYGVTKRDIARRSGVGDRTIYETCSGVRTRISRTTAHKVMATIERIEKLSERAGTTAA